MNKKSLLSLTAGIFTLFACSDSVVETDGYNSPIETKSKLTVVVEDAVTGNQLKEGVSVVFPGIAGTQLSTGAVVFENVYVGNYNIVVSGGAGYASVTANTGIEAVTDQNVHIAYDWTEVVKVYPLTSNLSGQVYYTNKDGINVPAAGVKVQLHFNAGCNLLDRIYDAKAATDASGKYVFEGLPAYNCSSTLYALGDEIALGGGATMPFQTTELTGGLTYNLTSGTEANNAGTRVISQARNTAVFIVTGYNEVIADTARTKAIEFTFSDDIDMSGVNNSTVSYGSEVAQVTWGAKKVTLTPASSWNNDFDVYFNNLRSVTGKSLSSVYYPVIVNKTNISGRAVSGLKINNHVTLIGPTNIKYADSSGNTIDSVKQGDQYFRLVWNKVVGADNGYVVYCKDETMNNYATCNKYSSVIDAISPENDTAGAFYPPSYGTIGKRKISFMVQASNSQYKTILAESDSTLLVLKDNRPPVKLVSYNGAAVPPQTKDSVFGDLFWLDNSRPLAIGTADSIREIDIWFTEDMDINPNGLTLSAISSHSADPLTMLSITKLGALSYEWMSKTQLRIRVVIKGTVSMTAPLDAKFSITGLKDQNGNLHVVKYYDSSTGYSVQFTDISNSGTRYGTIVPETDLKIRLRANGVTP